jgi:hypothetical protein
MKKKKHPMAAFIQQQTKGKQRIKTMAHFLQDERKQRGFGGVAWRKHGTGGNTIIGSTPKNSEIEIHVSEFQGNWVVYVGIRYENRREDEWEKYFSYKKDAEKYVDVIKNEIEIKAMVGAL